MGIRGGYKLASSNYDNTLACKLERYALQPSRLCASEALMCGFEIGLNAQHTSAAARNGRRCRARYGRQLLRERKTGEGRDRSRPSTSPRS
jgi:hypothetical protein